jgi:hypothetical protein
MSRFDEDTSIMRMRFDATPIEESNETDMPDAHSRLAGVCLRDAAKDR